MLTKSPLKLFRWFGPKGDRAVCLESHGCHLIPTFLSAPLIYLPNHVAHSVLSLSFCFWPSLLSRNVFKLVFFSRDRLFCIALVLGFFNLRVVFCAFVLEC